MNVQKIKKQIAKFKDLRWFGRTVVVLATGSSVWANWLHSEKNTIAITINVAPPLLFLLAYEMSSRIPMWGGKLRRWIRPVTMLAIIGINAWLSYWHQHDAFWRYTHDKSTANMLPFAIDALMIIASVGVMDLNEMIEQRETWLEAGAISTYEPPKQKEKDPIIPKEKEKGPSKKEKIIELLSRYPEMPIPEVAKNASAELNYVYGVRSKLLAKQQSDSELAIA